MVTQPFPRVVCSNIDNSFTEEILNIQTKLLLAQLEIFFSCSSTYYLGEETNILATNERIDLTTVLAHFAFNTFSSSYTLSTKEES